MEKSDDKSLNATRKVALDVILLILVGTPLAIFEFGGVVPVKRGFFCNDESIRYPLQAETFSTLAVFIIGICVPIAVIVVTELVVFVLGRKQYEPSKLDPAAPAVQHQPQYTCLGKHVHPVAVSLYKYVGCLLFIAAVGTLATDIMKTSLGFLRPHFLAVCKPRWSRINCTDSQGNPRLITEDVCTNRHVGEVYEARYSFPSGHANFAVSCLLYLTLYLQVRVQWRGSRLLKHCGQVALLFLALYISASRVSDYHHHSSDVVAGGLLGAAVATLCFCVLFSEWPRSVLCFNGRPNICVKGTAWQERQPLLKDV